MIPETSKDSILLRRLRVSLAAVAAGWVAGNLVPFLIAVMVDPAVPMKFWGSASALFCIVGWLLLGMPLALTGKTFSGRTRFIQAGLLGAVVGLALIVLAAAPWMPGAEMSPAPFLLVAGCQAAFTGAASIIMYYVGLEMLEPRKRSSHRQTIVRSSSRQASLDEVAKTLGQAPAPSDGLAAPPPPEE